MPTMQVRVLGAHNIETRDTRLAGLLIDGVLALDAGSLSSSLTLTEQGQIRGILLTHRHLDHIRDLPTLGLATETSGTVDVFGIQDTLGHLTSRYMDGSLYPNFTQRPSPEQPKLRLNTLEPYRERMALSYSVLPVPVPHGVPAVGYQVTSSGTRLFYTGDTGQGLRGAWQHTSPDLIVVEVTLSDAWEERAVAVGHMTPRILREELAAFQNEKGYSPRILVVHMNPTMEKEIRLELSQVSRDLGIEIMPAYEGMTVSL